MSESTLRHAAKATVPPRRVAVTVVAGPDAGARATSTDEPLVIGSSSECGLVLTDRTVSRWHVELIRTSAGVALRDLGSSNGTFAGEVRIDRALVPVPAKLTLGDTTITLADADAEARETTNLEPIDGFVAKSAASVAVARLVRRLAPSAVSVLIEGETGTGKEAIARALHALSSRSQGPFETVDCGSLPATLIASELFGHERGAFTGADRRREGAFERADGGTVFLDEIGELPLGLQPALLGVLERRRFRRLGGEREIAVDVRVVSATHRDLRADANGTHFRPDLYFRLAASRVVVPPLRDRPEDIEPLVAHFVREVTGAEGSLLFGPQSLDALRAHRWSGNARELRNVVEASVAMGRFELEPTESVVPGTEGLAPYRDARARAMTEFEARYLAALVARAGQNASEAARLAKMDRPWLLQLLRRHGLR